MTVVYAVVLVAGIVALLAWVAATALGDTVAGWGRVDPERRFGRRGRLTVAGAIGFGLGGMSASFAGWPVWSAFAAAVLGGGAIVAVALRYGSAADRNG